MDLLVISGFLGSGKTTLLLEIAKALAASGSRIAIIENEVGSVAVDNQFLAENGLDVREIFSGCICCSLRLDLINTLLELERQCSPDIVILEPSGVAGPKQVIQSLYGYGGQIDSKVVLSVVDSVRFERVKDFSIPLIADGIEIADAVIINKTDLVDAMQIAGLKNRIRHIRGDAYFIEYSALDRKNFGQIIRLIENKLSTGQTVESQTVIADARPGDMPRPTVIAEQTQLSVSDGVEDRMKNLILNIAAGAKQSGSGLIGHIKAIAKNNGGYMFASVTDFDTPVSIKGRLAQTPSPITLTVNAIVYGVSHDIMRNITLKAIREAT